MKQILNIYIFLLGTWCFSQVEDNFTDGDFTNNPTWQGTSSNFTINSNFQLQTSATSAGTSYLSLPHNLTTFTNKEWRIYTKLSFAGSSSNFAQIYLTADQSDLTTNPNGYYLQLGEALTTDAVRLMKRENGVSSEVCAGSAGAIATSANVGIRVVCDASNNWSLYVDYAGGENYIFQASANSTNTQMGTHAGILCTYTLSNATKFYVDNLYIGDEILDLEAPEIVSATVINGTNADVLFSETVEQTSAENLANYTFSPANTLLSATRDVSNWSLVHLSFTTTLTNGTTNTGYVQGVKDIAGNLSNDSVQFMYLYSEIPSKRDLIINEFMCDPSPKIGLPEVEFIEIYNRSSKIFNLNDWKLGDGTNEGTITSGWILPGEYKVLCTSNYVDSFPNAIAVTSFPSLNNSGEQILLKRDAATVIDEITYTLKWYQDAVKSEGGYSIERIHPNDPCSDQTNWKASNSPQGGTPGTVNSVHNLTDDTEIPQVTSSVAIAPNQLEINFSEGMDSLSLTNATLTTIPELSVATLTLNTEFPTSMLYTFQENLQPSTIYQFSLGQAADCWLNSAQLNGIFILTDEATEGDLVINEILFDPLTNGSDFVEIRNNSSKIIDMYGLTLANIVADSIGNKKQITTHFFLFPNEVVVLTADSLSQLQTYPASVPGRFIQQNIPSYNNDSGTVILLYGNQLIDRVSYLDDWHFKLLDEKDGKSLERIVSIGKSNDPTNWHTASETIGFATPGRENSQYATALTNGTMELSSEIISPDNDGFQDFLQINYQMNAPGMLGQIDIFDDRGRLIKAVVKNDLLSTQGTYIWDGLNDENQKVNIGTYVVVFKAVDIQNGNDFIGKKAFVVGGKI